ncbi:MAG TPA: M20 family metallo-hydrolase [Syntrophales bacterium]|nr:M20 family metallo-hydrolase [Syntrophales bacterium]
MNDLTAFMKITRRIENYEDAMIKMQMELTAIPALSPDNGGDGEYKKALCISSYLRKMNFPGITQINASDDRVSSGIRPNLFVTIPGKNSRKTIWVLTHIDVVPPGELKLWDSDPFQCYIKNGRIYGRGTEDNQQDMVSSIFAAKALFDEGITPEYPIGLAFVSDEETASVFGLSYILKHKKNPFRKADIIVVPDSGNEDGTMIEIAEKSIFWLRFKTIGKQCHASRPDLGRNSFQAASHLVVTLNNLHHIFDASDKFYQPQISTFQPTKKEPNVQNINTIPGEDVFYMDSRILPQYLLSDVFDKIREMTDEIERQFGVSIEITTIQEMQAPLPTPDDAPVVNALQEAVKEVYNVQATPQGIGGGTIAAIFRKNNYPAAVWSRVNNTAHQPNENCLISNMVGNAKVYAYLFMKK